jgi:DNA-binding MarR family transcriptional regulator
VRKQLGRNQRKALSALDYEPRTVDVVAGLAGLSRRVADKCTFSLAKAGYAVRSRGARNRVMVSVTEAGLNILVGVGEQL